MGLSLARSGVDGVVLEKHGDFWRDFRGDTIHPSTLEILLELGLLEDFSKWPHEMTRVLSVFVGDIEIPVADFSRLRCRGRFIAFMPQWHFLNFSDLFLENKCSPYARPFQAKHTDCTNATNSSLNEDQYRKIN